MAKNNQALSSKTPEELSVIGEYPLDTTKENDDYQEILLGEFYHTPDKEFAKIILDTVSGEKLKFTPPLHGILYLLILLLFKNYIHTNPKFYGAIIVTFILIEIINYARKPKNLGDYFLAKKQKKKNPPIRNNAIEFEQALYTLHQKSYNCPEQLEKMINILDTIDSTRPIEYYIANLNGEHWHQRFEARHALLRYGSDAIEALAPLKDQKDKYFMAVRQWILETLTLDSIAKIPPRKFSDYLCPKCFTTFGKFTLLTETGYGYKYHGCKTCGYNRYNYTSIQEILAILSKDEPLVRITGNNLVANWSLHRKIFNFDRVEILSATEKEIEQFCIQVGNDTDPTRHPKYKKMECRIRCSIDPNSLRILENTFGDVKRVG